MHMPTSKVNNTSAIRQLPLPVAAVGKLRGVQRVVQRVVSPSPHYQALWDVSP